VTTTTAADAAMAGMIAIGITRARMAGAVAGRTSEVGAQQ
jgi:hypothetical protein